MQTSEKSKHLGQSVAMGLAVALTSAGIITIMSVF